MENKKANKVKRKIMNQVRKQENEKKIQTAENTKI